MLDAVDEVGTEIVRLAHHLDVGESMEQLGENGGELSPCEVGAEAEVGAWPAEPDLGRGAVCDVHLVGAVEDPLVAVGRSVPKHHFVGASDLSGVWLLRSIPGARQGL